MADQERDPKVSSRYGELPREEPSAAIDAAILAAARRAAQTRPAPLVPPTGRQRWYFPLAAAAVIMLAVAVTLQVEREQPEPELAVVPAQEAEKQEQVAKKLRQAEPQKAPSVEKREAAPQSAPAPKPEPARERAFAADPGGPAVEATDKQKASAAAAASPPPPRVAEIPRERRDSADAAGTIASRSAPPAAAPAASGAPAARSEVQLRMLAKVQSPEQELERIAELRKQGRHEEADKALAEFRKRYPDFRISEEMLKRVEK
jgi:hypothetical protein